jgi:hypothetical protein
MPLSPLTGPVPTAVGGSDEFDGFVVDRQPEMGELLDPLDIAALGNDGPLTETEFPPFPSPSGWRRAVLAMAAVAAIAPPFLDLLIPPNREALGQSHPALPIVPNAPFEPCSGEGPIACPICAMRAQEEARNRQRQQEPQRPISPNGPQQRGGAAPDLFVDPRGRREGGGVEAMTEGDPEVV